MTEFSRNGLLAQMAECQNEIDSLDDAIIALQRKRALVADRYTKINEHLSAMNKLAFIDTVTMVELRYVVLPIPGNTFKAWVAASTLVLMRNKLDGMLRTTEKVAVRTSPKQWAHRDMHVLKSSERVVRDKNKSGIDIVEYSETCYIDALEYDKFYLQASGKWTDENLVRDGLKARVIMRE